MSSIYESNVDPLRPNDAHGISLQLVGTGKSVLELGAASGHVTRALKEMGNSVTAVERDGRFEDQLREFAESVVITDLDWLDLRDALGNQKFDVILAGDVLEHCRRPDLVLHQCHYLLNEGGYVVISLPNIAHGDVRLSLLTGRFDYRPTGLLDSTHLRFFTRESIHRFASENGFEVSEVFASTAPLGGTEFGPPDTSIPREAIEYVQRDRDHSVYQYVARFVPTGHVPSPELTTPVSTESDALLAELGLTMEALAYARAQVLSAPSSDHVDEIDSLKQENNDLKIQLASSGAQLHEENARLAEINGELLGIREEVMNLEKKGRELKEANDRLTMDLLHARDGVIGATAEVGMLRFQYEDARRQIDSLVHQLNLIHGSRTWRIGRFVLLPLRAVQRVLRKLLG